MTLVKIQIPRAIYQCNLARTYLQHAVFKPNANDKLQLQFVINYEIRLIVAVHSAVIKRVQLTNNCLNTHYIRRRTGHGRIRVVTMTLQSTDLRAGTCLVRLKRSNIVEIREH